MMSSNMRNKKPCIRLISFIKDHPTANVSGYYLRHEDNGELKAVPFNILCNMFKQGKLINVEDIDVKTRKIKFTDCSSSKVPIIMRNNFGSIKTIKGGLWFIFKNEEGDKFLCVNHEGEEIKANASDIIRLKNSLNLVNASVVGGKFIRGTKCPIPVLEPKKNGSACNNNCIVENVKSLSLMVDVSEEETLVSCSIEASNIKLTQYEKECMDDIKTKGENICYVEFSSNEAGDVVDRIEKLIKGAKVNSLGIELYSRLFSNSDGSVVLHVSNGKIDYKRAEGDYKVTVGVGYEPLEYLLKKLEKLNILDKHTVEYVLNTLKNVK